LVVDNQSVLALNYSEIFIKSRINYWLSTDQTFKQNPALHSLEGMFRPSAKVIVNTIPISIDPFHNQPDQNSAENR
jgi:hypothetical protein